jgi:hypothetical protein
MKLVRSTGLILTLSTVAIAGCGGGERSDDQSAQIKKVVETVVSSKDPVICTELQTLRFTEQVEFEPSRAAIRQCQKTVPRGSSGSAEVSDVRVDGDRATAKAAITGSSGFDGQTLEIALLRSNKRWKLDHIESFVDFDRMAYLRSLERELREPPTGLPAKQAKCFVGELGKFSDERLQRAFLTTDQEAYGRPFQACS